MIKSAQLSRLLIIIVLLCPVSQAQEFDSIPSQTLLFSSVANVTVVDSFFVSAGPGGISVFKFDETVQKFDFENHHYFDFDSVTVKRYNSTLFIQKDLQTVYVMDLSQLPNVVLVDSIFFPQMVADYEVVGQYIYTAAYFDGIQQYYYDGTVPVMIDSSMLGVLVTDLLVESDTLYAIDEYNGLLRYDLSGGNLGNYIDYIYSPKRLLKVSKESGRLYLVQQQGDIYIADPALSGEQAIVDSITPVNYAKEIFITDNELLVASQRDIYIYDKLTLQLLRVLNTQYNLLTGDYFVLAADTALLLPDTRGGVTILPLDGLTEPYQGLIHASEIHEMYIYNDKLFISGPNEPVKVFSIDDTGAVTFDYSIYPDIINSTDMVHNGDSLLVLYPELDRVAVYLNSTEPDSIYLDLAFSVGGVSVSNMYFEDILINNKRNLFVLNNYVLDIYSLSDSGYVQKEASWNFIAHVYTMNVIDSFLFISTAKGQLLTYKLNDNYTITFLNEYNLHRYSYKSVEVGKSVYLFDYRTVYKFGVDDSLGVVSDSVTELSSTVRDIVYQNGKLYSAGYDGLSAYTLNSGVPELLQHSGKPAYTIAVSDKIIAASNGDGLLIYRLANQPADSVDAIEDQSEQVISLLQNYPNPFNAITSIQFSLSQPQQITLEIFNILGRKVAEPVNRKFDIGSHQIEWDGTNQSGQQVATGVYFYRIATDSFSETKKMVLLK